MSERPFGLSPHFFPRSIAVEIAPTNKIQVYVQARLFPKLGCRQFYSSSALFKHLLHTGYDAMTGCVAAASTFEVNSRAPTCRHVIRFHWSKQTLSLQCAASTPHHHTDDLYSYSSEFSLLSSRCSTQKPIRAGISCYPDLQRSSRTAVDSSRAAVCH